MNRMSKPAAAAVLALSLVLGICIGIGTDRWYVNRNFHKIARAHFARKLEGPGLARFFNPPPPRERKGREQLIKDKLMKELTRQLELSSEQVKKIDTVLEKQRKEIEKNRERFFLDMRGTVSRTYGEIMKNLDADQKAQFGKIIDNRNIPAKRDAH